MRVWIHRSSHVTCLSRLSVSQLVPSPGHALVICITGNGLKTPDAVSDIVHRIPVADAQVKLVAELVANWD